MVSLYHEQVKKQSLDSPSMRTPRWRPVPRKSQKPELSRLVSAYIDLIRNMPKVRE